MAIPMCARCEWKQFEVSTYENAFTHARAKVLICAKCGAVAGIFDAPSIAKLERDMREIKDTVDRIQRDVENLRTS